MSEVRVFFKRLIWTFSGECACVVMLVDAELVRVRSVITAALSENEGTISEAICDVRRGFPVEASSDVPSLSAGGSSD